MVVLGIASACLLAAMFAAVPLHAQDIPYYEPYPVFDSVPAAQEEDWHSILRFDFTAGDGVGHEDSYFSLGVFHPLWSDFDSMWYVDVQGIAYTSSPDDTTGLNGGGNAGLGRRWTDPNGDGSIGLSLWYDAIASEHNTWQQVSLGVESFGHQWEWWANAYIPLGDTEHDHGQFTEQALPGADLEIGQPLWESLDCYYLAGYLGGYLYIGDDEVMGGSGRILLQYSPSLSMESRLTYDNYFGFRATFGLTWLMPGGRCKRCHHCPSGGCANCPVIRGQYGGVSLWRLTQPAQRNPNIVVTRNP